MIYSSKREHSMQTGYWRKRNILFVMLVAFVLFSINASAHEYDALITENVPPIGKAESLHELYGFIAIPISPEDFVQAAKNDEKYIEHMLEYSGHTSYDHKGAHSDQMKRFVFADVPISCEPADVVVIRYGNDPSYLCFVFTCERGEWNLIDVLPGVHSVDIVYGSTNSWLIASTYAFQYTIEIETIYNLVNRAYETHYISHAAISVSGTEQLSEGVIYLSGNVRIDDFSIVEDDESVNHCYFYVVKDTSICSIDDGRLTEYAAETAIDIFEYDNQRGNLEYIQTNSYEDIGRATIDSILRWEVLMQNTPVIKE